MSPVRSAERAVLSGPPGRAVASPAIHTIELSKRYRAVVALAGLSMTVARGEVFGFLGPNGAGKTTAVKLLLGLARPTGGEAMVLGAPAGDLQTRRQIGYLPELFRFQSWLTAREVLVLHCRLMRLPRPGWAAAADDALHVVGLDGRGDDKVGTFSKGMQQRLGLGVALLGEPALVVLDEPTSALDPVGRHRRSRDHPRAARPRHDGLPQHPPARGGRARLRPRDDHQQGPVARHRDARRAEGPQAQCPAAGDRPARRLVAAPGQLRPLDRGNREGDWLLVEDMAAGRVPELVAAIVALGGRVEAVIPEQQSLEESFLKLLGKHERRAGGAQMSAVLTIASLTVREAVRRRLVAAFAVISVVLVGASGWGFYKLSHGASVHLGRDKPGAPPGGRAVHVHVQLRGRAQRIGHRPRWRSPARSIGRPADRGRPPSPAQRGAAREVAGPGRPARRLHRDRVRPAGRGRVLGLRLCAARPGRGGGARLRRGRGPADARAAAQHPAVRARRRA